MSLKVFSSLNDSTVFVSYFVSLLLSFVFLILLTASIALFHQKLKIFYFHMLFLSLLLTPTDLSSEPCLMSFTGVVLKS